MEILYLLCNALHEEKMSHAYAYEKINLILLFIMNNEVWIKYK